MKFTEIETTGDRKYPYFGKSRDGYIWLIVRQGTGVIVRSVSQVDNLNLGHYSNSVMEGVLTKIHGTLEL